jgi:tRNA-2-methylthio-N6-dimethylallyladenosine synthase
LHQGPAAFVSIMTGCNKYCSFCIVPLAKGKEVSRHSQAILAEIRSLVEQGIKEVTLLGQTVNSYGRGLDEAITFEDLIDQISAISGIERIRFTSPYPGELTPRLLEQFRDNPKLCHHIHLPVQSGSNPILKRMRRRYTREDYLQSIADLKKYCPDIAITSDFIVGFPGETDADFQETLSLIRLVGFDTSYSFKYSIRPETKAAEFSDQVPEEVKLRRLSELQEIQQEITLQKHKSLIESIQEVLVEGPGIRPRQVTGRTSGNKIVNFAGPASMGELIRVKIIRACKNSLVGLMMTNSESSGSFRNSTVTTEF